MKSMSLTLLFVLAAFSFIACDTVTEPEEEGGGGGGGGSGPHINYYITELDASIDVMNTQTSGPVGGAHVKIERGSSFSESGYTNSSGHVDICDGISIYLSGPTSGCSVDVTVSAPGFSTVILDNFMVQLTFLESGSGWVHYAIAFSHTVNLTPSD